MSLFQKIETDYIQAFKAKNQNVVGTLRLLKSAIANEEIASRTAGEKQEIADEAAIKVIKSEIKKRRDSLAEYAKANRTDLAAQEESEIKILEQYLPAQLSETEIAAKIDELLAALPEADRANFGKAMGQVMKGIGSAADGTLVRKILEQKINPK